jgi:hypothetical protein
VSYVIAGYGVTLVLGALYAWRTLRQGRRLTRDLPEEERPWR